MRRTCSIGGCIKAIKARGWCAMHYMRWSQHGDPMWETPTAEERFWAKVDKTKSCWLWTGSRHDNGYAQFSIKYEVFGAHRFAYELVVGPIPEGLVIDHLCRVRHCVNPAHLEAVPQSINVLRGQHHNRLKTHCPQGHSYVEENVLRDRRGHRHCRECNRLRSNAYYQRRKSTRSAA